MRKHWVKRRATGTSALDVAQRHQRHRMRMRVRDDKERRGHNCMCAHEKKCAVARSKEVYSVYTPRRVQ